MLVDQLAKLDRAAKAGEFDAMEHVRRQKEVMDEQKRAAQEGDRATAQQWSEMVRLANVVLPVGWLPLGVMAGGGGAACCQRFWGYWAWQELDQPLVAGTARRLDFIRVNRRT